MDNATAKAEKAATAARNDYTEYRRWITHGPATRRHLKKERSRALRRLAKAECLQG